MSQRSSTNPFHGAISMVQLRKWVVEAERFCTISETHSYKIQMGLGRGTYNYAELVTAKNLIHFALLKRCTNLQLFGDSKLVINWINKNHICNAYTMKHILDEIHRLVSFFYSFNGHHIYNEQNTIVDCLSKATTIRDDDTWLICEELDGVVYQHYHKPFVDPEALWSNTGKRQLYFVLMIIFLTYCK